MQVKYELVYNFGLSQEDRIIKPIWIWFRQEKNECYNKRLGCL